MTLHRQTTAREDGRSLHLYGREPLRIEPAPAPARGTGQPHLRWHPLREEWVVYAAHRQQRTFLPPPDFDPLVPATDPRFPTEVPPGNWEVAAFDNLFPALRPDAHEVPPAIVPTGPARGACEVVVYTQDPKGSLGGLSLGHLEVVIAVWAERTREIGARSGIDYVFPFENRGEVVGVTLHHPHGQIYAYPFVPPIPARAVAAEEAHLAQHGRGLLETLIEHERTDGRRILYDGHQVTAWVPVCARYAYEVWIAPRRRVGALQDLSGAERADLARALKTVLLKYDGLWGMPFPYVMAIHQAPTDGSPRPACHLRFEFYPPFRAPDRLKYLAGTEIGVGTFAADTLPEDKAAELQAVEVTVE